MAMINYIELKAQMRARRQAEVKRRGAITFARSLLRYCALLCMLTTFALICMLAMPSQEPAPVGSSRRRLPKKEVIPWPTTNVTGYFYKRGQRSGYKKRYFVLNVSMKRVYYYDNEANAKKDV